MSRVRRRVTPGLTEHARWQLDRDFLMAQQTRAGYGIRPREWWLYESGRPDLAPPDTAHDIYCHLADDDLADSLAAERLRFLAISGELTNRERREIHERAEKEVTRYQRPTFAYPPLDPSAPSTERRAFMWRSDVLREVEDQT